MSARMGKPRGGLANGCAPWRITIAPLLNGVHPKPGWRPAVGDRVRLLALGKAADVLAITDDGLQLTVRCGVMRTTVESGGGGKPGWT